MEMATVDNKLVLYLNRLERQ